MHVILSQDHSTEYVTKYNLLCRAAQRNISQNSDDIISKLSFYKSLIPLRDYSRISVDLTESWRASSTNKVQYLLQLAKLAGKWRSWPELLSLEWPPLSRLAGLTAYSESKCLFCCLFVLCCVRSSSPTLDNLCASRVWFRRKLEISLKNPSTVNIEVSSFSFYIEQKQVPFKNFFLMELIRVYFSLFHRWPNLFLLTLVLPVHKTLLFEVNEGWILMTVDIVFGII